MTIISCKISEIKPNPDNPRLIKDDKYRKLVQSIKDFPEMLSIRPVVVDNDMMVLGGNMRLKACGEAGLKEIPVLKASDLTPEQQKEFIIKDNQNYGAWDFDILANDFEIPDLENWGFEEGELVGFDKISPGDFDGEKNREDSFFALFNKLKSEIILKLQEGGREEIEATRLIEESIIKYLQKAKSDVKCLSD